MANSDLDFDLAKFRAVHRTLGIRGLARQAGVTRHTVRRILAQGKLTLKPKTTAKLARFLETK